MFFQKFIKLVQRSRSKAINLLMKETNADYRNTILLAGSGRSGTTWLAELLNHQNSFRFIFEPYNVDQVNETSFFRERQFLRASEKNDRYRVVTEQILTGQIRNSWTDMFNKKIKVEKRLVKVIRANLFLKWVKVQFPELEIIFILRHPFAVAQSRIKLGFDTHLNDLFDQSGLLADFQFPYSKEVIQSKTLFEQQVFLWCVETILVLQQFKEGELFPVFYEELLLNPEKKLLEIFDFLNQPFDRKSIQQKINKRSKSVQTRKDISLFKNDWSHQLGEQELKQGLAMLAAFEMDRIYDASSLPLLPSQKLLEHFD